MPSLVQSLAMALVIPVLPLFARQLGASDSMVGLTVAARGIGGIFLAPYAGNIVGSLGVRGGSAMGVAVMGVAGVAAALSPSMLLLLMSRAADGFGLSLFQVGRATYLSKAVPATSRGSVSSLVAGMTRLGSTFGPAAGGALATMTDTHGALGYRLPFWTQALVFALAAALLLRFLDPGDVHTNAATSNPATTTKVTAPAANREKPAAFVFSEPARVLLPIVVALMVARSARETLLPLRGADLGLDAAMIGYITALSFTLDTALVPVAGYVMDRYGRKIACVPALVLLAIGFGALCVLDGVVGVLVSALALGLGNGLSNGWIQTVGADLAPEGFRPQFLGYWSAGLNAGSAAGPIIVGIVAQHTGSTQTASLVVGLCIAASAAWYGICGTETLVKLECTSDQSADASKTTAPNASMLVHEPKPAAPSGSVLAISAARSNSKVMV